MITSQCNMGYNNCLQRTRGTMRAASVRAVALTFEAERYV